MRLTAVRGVGSTRRWFAALFALVLITSLAGPVAAKTKGPHPPEGTSPEDFDSQVGRRLYPLALARGGEEVSLRGNSGRYLRVVFEDLTGPARRQRKLDYTLHVLSSRDRVDAWAYPDGSVFVTLGLLRRLPTVDEVAGVLAHQLAHAVLRQNLNGLTSREAQALLADIASGKVPPVREKLGRYGVTLLGEFYGTSEERSADNLARSLLRQGGFAESGLEYSFRRLVGTSAAYLSVHPHPGLRALPGPEQPPLIVIETEPGPVVPPVVVPPVVVPPVVVPPSSPSPKPAPPLPATPLPPPPPAPPLNPSRFTGTALLAGVIPGGIEESNANLQLWDDYRDTGPAGTLSFQTSAVTAAPALAGIVEVPFSNNWQGLFGLGGSYAKAVKDQPAASTGFLLAGVQQRGGVDGQGLRWALGPYFSLNWAGLTVGKTPAGVDPSWSLQLDGKFVEAGVPITAQAVSFGLGVLASVSGDSPARGLSWFAGAGYQAATSGEWSYTTKNILGEQVTVPTTGPNAAPFRPAGPLALAGVVWRF